MRLNIISKPKTAVVITPTTGQKTLTQCTDSVHHQTYKNTKHLVVVDGGEYFEKTFENASVSFEDSNIQITCNPTNTGSNGFYGHRIYAAYPHLVDEDYVFFLDDDNWYDPEHVESLIDIIETKKLDWSYSLRKVFVNDDMLDYDCCEAIGKWPIYFTAESNTQDYLVDTSCYCFKREFLIQVCNHWHFGWGGDRRFYKILTQKLGHKNYDTSGQHTLNYRLPDMDRAYGGDLDFFSRGNQYMKQKYGGKYPWQTSQT